MSTAVSTQASDAAVPDESALGGDSDLHLDIVPTHSLLARVGAEAFGAFVIVFIGVGTSLWWSVISGPTTAVLGVSLAFGIAVLGATAAVGQISGGHFNPAATLGAAIGRRLAWADLVPYWVAQLIGALVAGTALFLLMPAGFTAVTGQSNRSWFSNTANGFGEHSPLARTTEGALSFGLGHVLLIEIVAAAVLVGVILATTDRQVNAANAVLSIGPAAAVGFTYVVLHALATPFSNGALNPARATASALYSDAWALGQLWVFWVGPLVGGALAGIIYLLATRRDRIETGDWPDDELALEHGEDPQATAVLARGAAAAAEYDRATEEDEIDSLLARRAATGAATEDAVAPEDQDDRG